ncbi:MAG: type I secretion system permease/ATPase, partial [Verrucomicrobiota bacterium]
IIQRPIKQIHGATLPAVLLLQGGEAVMLLSFPNRKTAEVAVLSAGGGVQQLPVRQLEAGYTGFAILAKPVYDFESRSTFTPEPPKKSWFWGTLWKFRGFYARVGLATVMINILALASSLFIMNVYDRVVPNQAIDTLWALGAGALAAFILEFALKTLRSYFVDRAGHRVDVILGGDLFAKVLGLPYGSKPQSAGALAGQARSYEGLREFFTSATISALFDLPFVFVFAGIVFMLGGPAAIPLLVGACIALGFSLLMQWPISVAVRASYQAGNQRQALFVEGVNAMEMVKATRSESELQARMEQNVHISAKADGKARTFSQLALNTTSLMAQLVMVGIVVVGFFQVMAEAMTMGAMIACVILSGRAMAPLTMISSLLTRFQQSRRALDGLNQIMDAPSERNERSAQYIALGDFRPEIGIHQLSFSYGEESGEPALQGLNIRIQPGERVAILGRVGSGKSTLLRTLLGLYQPASGRIDFQGIDLGQIDPAELRRHIGYVPQDPPLLFGSLRSNLCAGAPWATDAMIWTAIERAGLAEYVRSLPRGIDHAVAEGGASLSGGQRQAVTIARALLEEPKLLVFDEPTAAMDHYSEKELLKQLNAFLAEDPMRTMIVATHKRSILSIVDRVIVIDGGKVIADGPRDEVIASQTKSPQSPPQSHPESTPQLQALSSPLPEPVEVDGPFQPRPDGPGFTPTPPMPPPQEFAPPPALFDTAPQELAPEPPAPDFQPAPPNPFTQPVATNSPFQLADDQNQLPERDEPEVELYSEHSPSPGLGAPFGQVQNRT